MSEWDEFEEVDEQAIMAILTDFEPPTTTTNPNQLEGSGNLPRSQTSIPTTTRFNSTGKVNNNNIGPLGVRLNRSQSTLNSDKGKNKSSVGGKNKSSSRISDNKKLETFFTPLKRTPSLTTDQNKNEPVLLLSDDDGDFSFDDEAEAFLLEQVENLERGNRDRPPVHPPPPPSTLTSVPPTLSGSQELGVDIDLIDLSDFDDEELAALAGCPTEPPSPHPPKNPPLLPTFNQPRLTNTTSTANPSNSNIRPTLPHQGRGQVSATTQPTIFAGLLPFIRRPYRPPEQCYETRHPYRPLEYCPDAITTWIYPTNYPVREYQFNIVQKALHENTLVCLPTGLGKTFIAAVIMFNYFRWFPDLKVIFMAPTKPLVAQQIEACYHVCGITQEESVEMTGALPPSTRAELWKSKRVFYLTPQVVCNDLTEGLVSPSAISCIVIDEAHRAQKSYAYVTVVKGVYDKNPLVRVLALSATPGTTLDKVQSVVVNLNIARIEFRTEDALDLRAYTHGKQVDKVIVPLSPTIQSLATAFKSLIVPYLERLKKKGAFHTTDPDTASSFQLIQSRDRYRARASARGGNAWESGAAEGDFALCVSFLKQLELLTRYGITTFHSRLQGWVDESGPNSARYRQQMITNPQFTELLQRVRTITAEPNYLDEFKSHPKLGHLHAYLKRHFESQEVAIMEGRSQTKVMVFVQFRETVDEILQALAPLSPMVRPMSFIGQGNVKSGKGLKQREQIEVIARFKKGGFNVLVSTSIGEEGLDIGEVDLIICYDSHSSPIRMLQRGGRTGRRREGKICILLTQGKEERALNQSKSTHNAVLKGIQSNRIMFFPDNPRMLPEGVIPECVQKKMEIAPYLVTAKPSRSKKARNVTPSPSESAPDEVASLPPRRSGSKKGTKSTTSSKRKKKQKVIDDDDESLDDLPSLTFDAPWRNPNPTKKVSSVKGRIALGESIDDVVSSRVTDLRSKFNSKRQSTSRRTGRVTPPPAPSSPLQGNLNSTSPPHSHRPQEPSATTPPLGHDDLSFDIPDLLTDIGHHRTPPPATKIKYHDIPSRMLLFFSRFDSIQHHPSEPDKPPPSFDPTQPTKPAQSHPIHPSSTVAIPPPLSGNPPLKVTQPNTSQSTIVSLGLDPIKPRSSLSSFTCTTSKSPSKLLPNVSSPHFLDSSQSDFSKLIRDVKIPADVQVISDESLSLSLGLSSHQTSKSREVPPVVTDPVVSPILLDSSPPRAELSPRRVVPDVDPDRTESSCVRGGRRILKRRIIDGSPSVSQTILSLSSDDPDLVPSPTGGPPPILRRRPPPSPVLSSSVPLSQSDKRLKLQALASKRRPTHRHYMELEAEESGEDLSSDELSPGEEGADANDSFVCGDDEVLPDSDAPPDDDDANPSLTDRSIDMQAIYRQSIQSQVDPDLGFATRPQQYGLQGARFRYLPAKRSCRRRPPRSSHSPPSGGAPGEDDEDDSFIVDDAEPVVHSAWTSPDPDPTPVNRQVLEALCDLPSSEGSD